LSFLEDVDLGNTINKKVTVFTEKNLWQIDEQHLLDQTYEKHKVIPTFFGLNRIGHVRLHVLDIKGIHLPVTHKDQDRMNLMFDELQNNGAIESYALPGVKALIEVRWSTIWWKMIVFFVLPYIVFLLLFSIYTILDFISEETAEERDRTKAASGLSLSMIVLIIYFLLMAIA